MNVKTRGQCVPVVNERPPVSHLFVVQPAPTGWTQVPTVSVSHANGDVCYTDGARTFNPQILERLVHTKQLISLGFWLVLLDDGDRREEVFRMPNGSFVVADAQLREHDPKQRLVQPLEREPIPCSSPPRPIRT